MPHKRAKKSLREQQKRERGADLAPPGDNTGNGMGIGTERIPKSAARVLDAARIREKYRQKKRARMQMEGTDANANDNHTGDAPKLPPHKKRRTTTDAGAGAAEKSRVLAKGNLKEHHQVNSLAIEIQPGESLKHFNRRVEDHMRPLVQSAMRASAATKRKERKGAAAASTRSHTSTTTKVSNKSQSQQPPSSPPPSSSSNAHKNSKTSTTTRHDGYEDHDDHRPKEFAVMSSAAPRRLNDIAMAPPELKKLPRGVKSKHNSPGVGGGKGKAGVLSMAQRVMMEAERESVIKRYREMKERKAKEADRTLLSA